jgi:pyruvate formate-lyase activating enzyme-like uncharacterized protein
MKRKYISFQLGFRCNTHCDFCFLPTYMAEKTMDSEVYHRQSSMKQFHRCKHELAGIAITGGEPLLYVSELEKVVSEMKEAKSDLHFWIYTNGILADEQRLVSIRELGIREIRFNLAANNYDEKTLSKVELARDIFEYIVVEVPSYPRQKDRLIKCLPSLNRIRIDQLNLQELLITQANMNSLEGEGYQSGMLFLTKYFLYGSRKMSIEVMQYCADMHFSFTVNECSASWLGRG